MKYVYLLTVIIFMGCSDKSASVQKRVETKAAVVVSEVRKAVIPEPMIKEVVKHKVVSETNRNVTMVEEEMVMKNIGSDIPTSCVMWSDGCNVCTRKGRGKSSCTTNPECTNKVFSCLQWQ